MYPLFTITDIIAIPFTIILLYIITYFGSRKYVGMPIYKYIFPALTLKIMATFAYYAYHYFAYGGGDTFQYFFAVKQVQKAAAFIPWEVVESLFQSPNNYAAELRNYAPHVHFNASEESYVVKLGFLVGIINYWSFLPICLLFSFFAFAGTWRLYKVFYDMYPDLHKPLALTTLFFPTIVFWASCLSKEPLVFGCLGLMVYNIYQFFIKKRRKLVYVLMLPFLIYTISAIKGYIIVAFAPAIIVWLFLQFQSNIKNKLLRMLMAPAAFAGIIIFALFTINFMASSSLFSYYASEQLVENIQTQYVYLTDAKRAGSTYNIGKMDGTTQGLIRMVPAAINVTLFRPYLWEVNNAASFLACLESMFTMLLTVWIILKTGLIHFFKQVFATPFLLGSFIFVLVFAAAVGLTSGNFGTLMRFKLPCMPFYLAILVIVWKESQKFKFTVLNH